jgi:uncharacterized repeat protein (TIGR01451 family)
MTDQKRRQLFPLSITLGLLLVAGVFAATAQGDPDPLSLTKSIPLDAAIGNQPLTYTLRVQNLGPLTGTNVVLTDTLPAGLIFGSAAATQGNCIEVLGTVSCQLGDMGYLDTVTTTILVTPTISGVVSNTASVTAEEPDPVPGNNTATVLSTIFEVQPQQTYMPVIEKSH